MRVKVSLYILGHLCGSLAWETREAYFRHWKADHKTCEPEGAPCSPEPY